MAEATLCRLCAVQKDRFLGIYEEEGLKLDLERKITKCLQIELGLNDLLPKIVCLDCCAKLNQCSEFLDASADAQIALYLVFRQIKEEINIIDHQDFEAHENNSVSNSSFTKEQSLVDNFGDKESEEQSDQSDLGNILLETISPSKLEIDQGPVLNSKRKRRIPIRLSMQLKSGETVSGVNVTTPLKDSLHLESVRRIIKVKMESTARERSPSKNTLKVPDSDLKCIEGPSKEILVASETPVANPRKRRDGWELYPWTCTDCSEELPSMQALRTHHQNIHNQAPRFMCAQCSKVYTKYYGFVSHVRRHRNHMKFCCEECGKCFSNKKVLESHRATHSDARPFVCSECGKSFRQQSALYVHNRSHMPESVKNKFSCDQCDKRFSTKPNLITHKRIHTGIRNYTCDQCGKSFIQKGNLDAHLLTHSSAKPYLCPICNKGFKTQLQLRKHQTIHTGAKPHQCDVCGRQFRERGTLKEHHRIHTGAMPFTCEFCGKSFRFKGILTTHRRQHTGERPYSCLQCQHHFTNWPNYNKHMKRRHGINTSHQPDPNKIAVPNANANTPQSNSINSNNDSLDTVSGLLVMHHQHLQTSEELTSAEPCETILGLPSEVLDHPPVSSGASSLEYCHHAASETVSCVNISSLTTHPTVGISNHLEPQPRDRLCSGPHFYGLTSSAHVSPYVGTTSVPLGFYNISSQISSLESTGSSMDMLPSVQER